MPELRDWHGVRRDYERDGQTAATLRELAAGGVLDRDGVRAAWGELDDPFATVIAGVRQLPCRTITRSLAAWALAFEAAVARIARAAIDPIVALGGGLDAAAVLVAWRASGCALPAAVTLATGLSDYDEVEPATSIARELGMRCEVIEVTAAQIVAQAAPAAIAAETALYNLHPVHRLALSSELARRGAATLVTGDGADACHAGRPDLDYVPIVAALTRAAGLALMSPFFADEVIAATAPDADRHAERAYLRERGLGWLADRPKRPRRMPALPLPLPLARMAELSRALDLPLDLDLDHRRVGWYTLDAVARDLGVG